jgi:hypothetical protein
LRRRDILLGGAALAAAAGITGLFRLAGDAGTEMSLDALIADIEERTFRYFWLTTNPLNGLARDRFPSASAASVAAVGFALTACPIGAERGYVGRTEAAKRALATLRFLDRAQPDPDTPGPAGYKGFFYHYLEVRSGERAGTCEVSTIDTALLLAGVLFCQSYFDAATPQEQEIRDLADSIYRRVDWRWAQTRPPSIGHGWTPEKGPIPYDWMGFSEAAILYLLALGSPTHAVGEEAWTAWTATFDGSWGSYGGEPHVAFASLFGHLCSHAWVDFRDIRDGYIADRGLDYFENSRRAVHAQRAYAIANPGRWKDYGPDVWGISASDGPADGTWLYEGEPRRFRTYAARGAAGPWPFDDGTLTPTAVLAALGVAPEVAEPAIATIYRRYGRHIYSTYGFLDAFNPSFDFDVPVHPGRIVPGTGWVDSDYIGIDQGLILAMVENYRSGLVWRVMRRNPYLRRGLERAGFTGGWLDAAG